MGINLPSTVVAIVKEVGESMNAVPYLKSLSGVVLIIKIRESRCMWYIICISMILLTFDLQEIKSKGPSFKYIFKL
jgi:hypothetical protein